MIFDRTTSKSGIRPFLANAGNQQGVLYLGRDEARCVVFALLLVLVGLSHQRPQHVTPLQAIFIVLGFILLVGVLMVLRWRAVAISRTVFSAILMYFIFVLWAWRSSETALVPAFAREYFATYLEGFWILIAAYLALAPSQRATNSQLPTLNPACRQGRSQLSTQRIMLWMVTLFFTAIAVIAAIYAICQYLWIFERQLAELEKQGLYTGTDRLSDGVRHALRERRVVASFGNPNIFCGFLAFSLPFVVAGFVLVKGWARKAPFLAAIVVIAVAAYLTRSRAGMLCAVVAVTLTSVAMRWEWFTPPEGHVSPSRRRLALFGVAIVLLALIVSLIAIAAAPGGLQRWIDKSGLIKRLTNVTTFRERLFYAESGIRMMERAPVGGSGLAAYGVLYPQYKMLEARESHYAHNFAVQMVVEMGVVGLGLFIACIALIGAAARQTPKRSRHPAGAAEDSVSRGLVVATVVGFCVFLLNSLMEYTFYFREFYLDFCLMSGVLLAATAAPLPARPPAPMESGDRIEGQGATRRTSTYVWLCVLTLATLLLVPAYIVKPFLSSFYSYYGDDALMQKDAELALRQYERALNLQRDNPWLMHKVARTLFAYGRRVEDPARRDEGLAMMRRAVAANPYSAFLHDEMASLYHDMGLRAQAISEVKKAIQKYPYNARYHYRLAQMELERGWVGAALREAKMASQLERGGIAQSEYDAFLDALQKIAKETEMYTVVP